MIELMVTILIFGLLSSIAMWAIRGYQRAQEFSGTAHTLVSSLRAVGERAQSEGRTYCVNIDASGSSWSVWRYSCQSTFVSSPGGTAAQVLSNQRVEGSDVTLAVKSGAAFPSSGSNAGACPSGSVACVYFYPRGTASSGILLVQQAGQSNSFEVKVEGLTGRVDLVG